MDTHFENIINSFEYMINSTQKNIFLEDVQEITPDFSILPSFPMNFEKSKKDFKADSEFKIKITKALENLWRDEENRRNQMQIPESMKFYISYKNNLECNNSKETDLLPHNQIYDQEKHNQMIKNFESYYASENNKEFLESETQKNYSKCFYSNMLYQNFMGFIDNEKVSTKTL